MLKNLYSSVILLLALCFAWLIEQALKIAYYVQSLRLSFFSKRGLVSLMAVSFVMLPAVSFAAVPVEVTTAITDAVADVSTIGAAILGVIVVIASFMWMRRPIR